MNGQYQWPVIIILLIKNKKHSLAWHDDGRDDGREVY